MASNNFYLSNDPLLFSNRNEDTSRQLNDMMQQYYMMQQQKQQQQQQYRDYVGELDAAMKSSSVLCQDSLNNNNEYKKLSSDLQALIQYELISTIKTKINCNQNAIRNIERQIELIKETNDNIETEQKQNLIELNDYVKNYSNITFDEYKKKKKQKTVNHESE